MANLKDLIVRGASRFIGKVYIDDSHITKINDVAVTDTPKFTDTTALGSMTGTLGVTHGGTGQTSAKNAANSLMNALDTGSSTPEDADYYISQYVGGGTTTTTYHRRPMSALWAYIKSKIDANGGYANKNVWGNVKVGSTTIAADAVQDTLELVAGSNVTITPDATNDKVTIAATDTTYTAASANPKMDGTVAVGTSAKYARQDHVHPHDTTKVDKETGKGLSTNDFTDTYRTKLADIAAGAEVNQNAFSAVKVRAQTESSTTEYTITADSKTDTLNIVNGDNITFTVDTTNDKITIDANGPVKSVAGKTGVVTLAKSDVGLGNVDNTADQFKDVFSATKFTSATTIQGLKFNGDSNDFVSNHVANTTASISSTQVASMMNSKSTFVVEAGARIITSFYYGSQLGPQNGTVTLNVEQTGAFPIWYKGRALQRGDLIDNAYYEMILYGNSSAGYRWHILNPSINTTYSAMTQAEADEGTSATGKLISPQVLRDTIEEYGGGGGGTTTLDSTIPYVQLDASSTSTAFTATISGITELKDGLTILVKNGRVTSASGVTFKLNNFDAKPIYYSTGATSRVSTHWSVNYTWLLTYDSERISGGCWLAYWGYDSNSNDTSAGYIRENHGTYKPTTNLYRYMICLQKNETQVVPLNTSSNNTGTGKTLTTEQFNPFGRIFYYATTGTVAADASISVSYLWTAYSNVNYRYSFNIGETLTPDKDIYLKAKLAQSDGLPMRTMAVLADDPIVQQLPLYEDEYIYIKLGHADTTTNGTLTYDHPIYVNRGGQIMLYQDHYNDWNTFKGYSRAERDWFQFSNYDNPGINGLFEVKTSEDTSLTGTPPYSGYYPMLSMQRGFVAMQFAGSSVSGDLYWRGRQSGAGNLTNIAWRKVIDSGTGVTTGTITSSHTINYQHLVKDALGNVSMYLQITLTSAVSQWAQLATIPSGFHPVHTMRILGLNGTTAIPAALNKSGQNGGSVQIGAAASSGAVIYITAHYNVN